MIDVISAKIEKVCANRSHLRWLFTWQNAIYLHKATRQEDLNQILLKNGLNSQVEIYANLTIRPLVHNAMIAILRSC